jgi:amidase
VNAEELAFAGIARQAELIRGRDVSSSELVDTYLERIERLNPQLNAFTAVLDEWAREQATEADRRIAAGERGPLLGVPVALKDEIDVEGLVASHGTSAFDRPAGEDAAHWRRLREAGAVLIGKTTMPELAICGFTECETFGETRNPWDPTRTPGGSSGGSGAAVAAGLVGAASGSDGAGSIRIPAANCGLFGLKPQRGRVSLAPKPSHWLGLDVHGCLSRRVADTALWLDVASGPEPVDEHRPAPPAGTYREAATREPGRLRVAWTLSVPRGVAPAILDEETRGAVERAAELLRSLGHEPVERDPRWGLFANDFTTLYLKAIEEHYDTVPHPERLESRTRGFKRLAATIPARFLRRVQAKQERGAARLNEVFEHCDVLLMPTVGRPAVEVGRWAGKGALLTLIGMSRIHIYTGPWNYTGQPAAAIPMGLSVDGLPLSVQLVGPPEREDVLLSLASQLERELAWPDRKPPIAVG